MALWAFSDRSVFRNTAGLWFSYGIYKGLTDPASVGVDYTGFSLVNIISWIISIAAVYGVYYFLEKKFVKEHMAKPSLEIEKIGNKDF